LDIEQKQIPRLIKAIESLTINPFPAQHWKIQGTDNLYRIRVSNYHYSFLTYSSPLEGRG